jgi:hypothetical protein
MFRHDEFEMFDIRECDNLFDFFHFREIVSSKEPIIVSVNLTNPILNTESRLCFANAVIDLNRPLLTGIRFDSMVGGLAKVSYHRVPFLCRTVVERVASFPLPVRNVNFHLVDYLRSSSANRAVGVEIAFRLENTATYLRSYLNRGVGSQAGTTSGFYIESNVKRDSSNECDIKTHTSIGPWEKYKIMPVGDPYQTTCLVAIKNHLGSFVDGLSYFRLVLEPTTRNVYSVWNGEGTAALSISGCRRFLIYAPKSDFGGVEEPDRLFE